MAQLTTKKTKLTKYIRIPLDESLLKYVNLKKLELPLLDEVDIIKIFISKGILQEEGYNYRELVNFLNQREVEGKVVTGLTEKEQEQLLIDNDLM